MDTFGRHFLVEYIGCCSEKLDDIEHIEALMNRAAIAASATVITSKFHAFAPQGVSGVVVIAESHLSIHTWPEVGYAAVDFYTCGEATPERAKDVLARGLGAKTWEMMEVQRGRLRDERSIHVKRHQRGGQKASAKVASEFCDEEAAI